MAVVVCNTFMEYVADLVDIATLRALPGGREANGELLLILARVAFDNYELFQGKRPPCRTKS